MSTQFAFGTIDVEYALYTSTGETFEPVSSTEDRDVENHVRAADTTRRVETSHDLDESSALLHEHVVETFYDFSYLGYSIDLAADEDSRWDPTIKDWRKILVGAARVYPLKNPNPAAVRLWMNVWTRGAQAAEAAVADG